jgi:hypothetical protein
MKDILILLSFFLMISCNNGKHSDSIKAASRFSLNYLSYLKTIKTPNGQIIKFKLINDSSYLVQWGDSLDLKTFPDTIYMDNHESWIPTFIAENKDYIVMSCSCGNPCWVGYFLPLRDSTKPKSIHEYLDFDIDNDLVAYIKDSKSIEIINLKSNQTEIHKLNDCSSAFPGYCIDSLSIKNRTLKYKWIPETTINSEKGDLIMEKIKI